VPDKSDTLTTAIFFLLAVDYATPRKKMATHWQIKHRKKTLQPAGATSQLTGR